MHCAPAQSQDPHVERNIKGIKERVRAIMHVLPYKHVPKTFIKYIVMEAANKLNYFPSRYGLSKYYSPFMILLKKESRFKKNCMHFTG